MAENGLEQKKDIDTGTNAVYQTENAGGPAAEESSTAQERESGGEIQKLQPSTFNFEEEAEVLTKVLPEDFYEDIHDPKRVLEYITDLKDSITAEVGNIAELGTKITTAGKKSSSDQAFKKMSARSRRLRELKEELEFAERMQTEASAKKDPLSSTMKKSITSARGQLAEAEKIRNNARNSMKELCLEEQKKLQVFLIKSYEIAQELIPKKGNEAQLSALYDAYCTRKKEAGIVIGESAKQQEKDNRQLAEGLKNQVDAYLDEAGVGGIRPTGDEEKAVIETCKSRLRQLFKEDKYWIPLLVEVKLMEKGQFMPGTFGKMGEKFQEVKEGIGENTISRGMDVYQVYQGATAGKSALNDSFKINREMEGGSINTLREQMLQSEVTSILVSGKGESRFEKGFESLKTKAMAIISPIIKLGKFVYDLYKFMKEKNGLTPAEKRDRAVELWIGSGGDVIASGCMSAAKWLGNIPWLGAVAGIIGSVAGFAKNLVEMARRSRANVIIQEQKKKLREKLAKTGRYYGMNAETDEKERKRLTEKYGDITRRSGRFEEKIASMRERKRYMSLEDQKKYREMKKLKYMQQLRETEEAGSVNADKELDSVLGMTSSAATLVGNIAKLCPGVGSLIGLGADIGTSLVQGGRAVYKSGKQLLTDIFRSKSESSTKNTRERRLGYARNQYGKLKYIANKLDFNVSAKKGKKMKEEDVDAALKEKRKSAPDGNVEFQMPDSLADARQVVKTAQELVSSFKTVGIPLIRLKQSSSRGDLMRKIAESYY